MTLLAILFALPAFSADAQAAVIELRREAAVASDTVCLQDVASVAPGVTSDEQLDTLKATAICSAPPPAESQILTAADVVSALDRAGVQLSGLTITGSKETVVRREYALLSADELTAAFIEHVARQTGWPPESFVANPPKNLAPLPVPPGPHELVVSTATGEDFSGSVAAAFEVRINGKPFRVFSHRFTVEKYVRTLVAAEKIHRGQSPEEGQFETETVELSRLKGAPVSNIEQLEGMTAVRTIYPGTAVDMGAFAMPPIVKRGETASLLWAGAGFNIVTKGLVLDNGRASEVVRVRLSSKKIVKALVTDSGLLEILD